MKGKVSFTTWHEVGKIEHGYEVVSVVVFGKASFGADKLFENLSAIMDAIIKAKPASAKGQYLRSITLTSTMGPGVKGSTAKF